MQYLVPLIALVIVAAIFVAALLIIHKDKTSTVGAYERLLIRRDAEYEVLADRIFLKDRLPPSGINLTELHQERVDQARIEKAERRLRGSQPNVATGIGPLDRIQNDMIRQYRKDHPTAAPASTVLEEQIHTRQNTGAVA